jgi:hypothetical protein
MPDRSVPDRTGTIVVKIHPGLSATTFIVGPVVGAVGVAMLVFAFVGDMSPGPDGTSPKGLLIFGAMCCIGVGASKGRGF